ncbi:MAG TPA: NfeD family protein [Dongiaceae bacterium]|jgi:hypothetical protein|nr:NfeD family protein [Dongiaceae bacterium]
MTLLFDHLQYWHWLSLALLLGIIELLLPGLFFIWLAGGALVTGVIVFAVPLAGATQLVLFAVLSLLSLLLWYRLGRGEGGAAALVNRRGQQWIGRVVVLSEAIENGRGYARLNDTVWRVEGPDLPAGTRVRIVGVEGSVLKVTAA